MNKFLDRKKGPSIREIREIPRSHIETYSLSNGIPVVEVNSGSQDVFKLELLNMGGRLNEDKPLVSRATAGLIKEASHNYNQKELATAIDYHGASLSSLYTIDHSSLILYSLNKFANNVLPLLGEVFYQPKFPESELEKFVKRNVNQLRIDTTKNDILAYREFTEQIFGSDHIYGYNSNEAYYNDLVLEDLIHYYDNYLGTNNSIVFLSGKITNNIRYTIDNELGRIKKEARIKNYVPSHSRPAKISKIFGKGNYQDALIIGRRLFNKQNPDYVKMLVFNTILGGYFGSRLMKSIRENSGYTYNIHSLFDTLRYDGFFYISSELDTENRDAALKEIYRQVDILQNDLVSDKELGMVKNYIFGNILNMLDGPFKVANWVKSNMCHGLSVDEGYKNIEKLDEVSSNDILELAQRYFSRESLSELVVTTSSGNGSKGLI